MRDLLSIGTSRGCEMIGTGIGLGLSGFRVNPPGALPVLDLRFSNDKTLVAFAGPTPSFSRASSGTYFGANGVLTSAAVNEPRFDHVLENGVWVSKGLLIEEQRTNLETYSEDFSNAVWRKDLTTVTTNQTSAPDNNTTADLVLETSANGYHNIARNDGNLVGHTFSVFLKPYGRDKVRIYRGGNPSDSVIFDLVTLSASSVGSNVSGYSIFSVGNGWVRCSVTNNLVSIEQYINFIDSSGSGSYTGDITKGMYVWGAQLESGLFPTSYIPTVASSVVRSADVCQITGSAFTNLWNASEGSIAFEADAIDPRTVGPAQTVYSADDGVDSTNSIYALRGGLTLGSDYWIASYRAGALQFNFTTAADFWSINVPFKSAIGFKLNDTAQSSKGLAVVTDTSCIVPTGLTQLTIGRLSYTGGTGFPINGHIARLRYYNTRLTDSQLQGLTL